MDYKYLLNFVDNILKENCLKRKSNNWYLESNDVIIVFNMQRSRFSARYYINIGINIKEINNENKFPKEYECHLSIGLKNYSLDGNSYFDLTNSIVDNDRENGVKYFIEEIVIKLIIKLSTINGIKEYCNEFPNDFLIMRPVMHPEHFRIKKYLGLIDNGK